MAKNFYSSGELMEAVKALGYKKKYEVLILSEFQKNLPMSGSHE